VRSKLARHPAWTQTEAVDRAPWTYPDLVDTPKGATMRQERTMAKRRPPRQFSPEFKAKTVRRCRTGNRSITQVAQDLDLTESALRKWLKQADVDAGNGPPDALTTAEKSELTQLRREVRQLRQDREILKAAATFFAKEKQ